MGLTAPPTGDCGPGIRGRNPGSAQPSPSPPATAASTSSAVSTSPVAPVQDTTTSTRVSSSATSAIGMAAAVTPVPEATRISASRSARSPVRFATAISATPTRARVAAASEDIDPAPITRARLPRAHSATGVPTASCSSPKVTSDWPARSIPVSECARLPTRSACWNRSLISRPAECSSWPSARASLSWPRICPSPTTIESSPHATENRWCTARSS